VDINNGKLNLMSKQFWVDLKECFLRLAEDKSIRVILLTSANPKFFTAGLDLVDTDLSSLSSTDEQDVARTAMRTRSMILSMQDSITAVESCPQPVVAAIRGACIGGGIDLISACDIRFCSPDAWFSIKEVDVGLAADLGTLQRLPKICGNHSLMKELCYTARRFDSGEAQLLGLVSNIVPSKEKDSDVLSHALRICISLASKSPVALVGTKVALDYAREHTIRDSLQQIATWNAACLQTKDIVAAASSFASKQPALFSNL